MSDKDEKSWDLSWDKVEKLSWDETKDLIWDKIISLMTLDEVLERTLQYCIRQEDESTQDWWKAGEKHTDRLNRCSHLLKEALAVLREE